MVTTDAAPDLNLKVESVTCTPTSIPCMDMKMTKVSCKGTASGYTGGATFVWNCIPIGCDIKNKEGSAPCSMVEVSARCESTGFDSEVEIACAGKMPEQCSLRIVKDNVVSDSTERASLFGIKLDPACPPPMSMDMGHDMATDGPADGGADLPLDVPSDVPQDQPVDAPVDVPGDVPADARDGGVG
jgi:hypothetical protein